MALLALCIFVCCVGCVCCIFIVGSTVQPDVGIAMRCCFAVTCVFACVEHFKLYNCICVLQYVPIT